MQTTTNAECRQEALRYAARGWATFPVRDKTPATPHGFRDASTDPGVVLELFASAPRATGVAIATGQVSQLAVVDFDAPGAAKTLATYGTMPATLVAQTSRGSHLYLASSAGLPTKHFDGFDVQGNQAYVLAPPSRHPSGVVYRFQNPDTPVADAPRWLLQLAGADLPRWLPTTIAVGTRHHLLKRLAGWLHRQELDASAIVSRLAEIVATRCATIPNDPSPVTDRFLADLVAWIGTKPVTTPALSLRTRWEPIVAAWRDKFAQTDARVFLDAVVPLVQRARSHGAANFPERRVAELARVHRETARASLRRLRARGVLDVLAPATPHTGTRARLRWERSSTAQSPTDLAGIATSGRFTNALPPAVRDLFRKGKGLGWTAERVYLVLSPSPQAVTALARKLGKTPAAVRGALHRLAEHGLAVKVGTAWVLGPADPLDVARQRGVLGAGDRQRAQHERERGRYRTPRGPVTTRPVAPAPEARS